MYSTIIKLRGWIHKYLKLHLNLELLEALAVPYLWIKIIDLYYFYKGCCVLENFIAEKLEIGDVHKSTILWVKLDK